MTTQRPYKRYGRPNVAARVRHSRELEESHAKSIRPYGSAPRRERDWR